MLSKGRQLHQQSAEAREFESDFLKALQISEAALLAYQEDGDMLGMAESVADRSVTFRHLYAKTNDKSFLIRARAELQASLDISKLTNNPEATTLPLYNLGKVEESLGNYPEAVRFYKEALATLNVDPNQTKLDPNNPAHHRPAQLYDMQVHMSYAEYKNGDKSAKDRMIEALDSLEAVEEEDPFNKDTWVSGGYLSLAEMLQADQPEEAHKYLAKAKQIIDANPKLILRAKQLAELSKAIS